MPILQLWMGIQLWKYIPSLPLSISFAGVFLLVTVIHIWKMIRTKMWFCTPFIIGGFFEVIGYASRGAAYNDTGSLIPYLLQSLFLLLAPIFFAATLYMVYSRIVRAVHGEHLSLISPHWTTCIFVFLDFSFLSIQSNGGGLLAKTKTAQIGSDIIVTGLILQVLGFIGFMVCCIMFHKRFLASQKEACRRRDRNGGDVEQASNGGVHTSTALPWQSCLFMLYTTSLAILVRNLFRVVEFGMGTNSFLQFHEWPVYTFDGALMLAVMLVFFAFHPSRLHPGGGTGTSAAADGANQRVSMIELMGDETAFQPERRHQRQNSAAAGVPAGSKYELEDWFWPAKVWSLVKNSGGKN